MEKTTHRLNVIRFQEVLESYRVRIFTDHTQGWSLYASLRYVHVHVYILIYIRMHMHILMCRILEHQKKYDFTTTHPNSYFKEIMDIFDLGDH